MSILLVALALVVLTGAPAAALSASAQAAPPQQPSAPPAPVRDFAALAGTLRPGTDVEVARDTTAVRGRVLDVTPTALRLSVDGQEIAFSAGAIRGVDRLRRKTARGATIGALAGAATIVASIVIAKATCPDCEDDSTPAIVAAAVGFYTAIGAGVGALIGSQFHDRVPIYRAPGAGRLIGVPAGPGVVIGYTVRF